MRTLAQVTGLMLCLGVASTSAQNLLSNSGFEDPITFDGPPFVGIWEGFSGGAGSSSANSGTLFRSGAQSLQLSINATANTFAGAFQDAPVVPGMLYSFGGYHNTTSSPFDVGVEIRIEWRNASAEISRTPNSTPLPTSSWTTFDVSATAPAGAEFARVVYAIQSFGAFPTDTGTVYIDDVSFVAVPEPSTMALLGLGGLALIALRRQR